MFSLAKIAEGTEVSIYFQIICLTLDQCCYFSTPQIQVFFIRGIAFLKSFLNMYSNIPISSRETVPLKLHTFWVICVNMPNGYVREKIPIFTYQYIPTRHKQESWHLLKRFEHRTRGFHSKKYSALATSPQNAQSAIPLLFS